MWWLWMLAGAAALAVGFTIWLSVVTYLDNRATAMQRTVAARQSAAESQMQSIVQDTISRMFDEARRMR